MSDPAQPPAPARRRFLAVIGSAAAGIFLPAVAAAAASTVHRWQGVALGADASLTLHHADRAAARSAIDAAVAELRRLEVIFSLYDPRSALSRLNRDGRLANPPGDLIGLLRISGEMHARTGGAFDPTVGPLFDLYKAHFAARGADPKGPTPAALAAAQSRVGFDGVSVGKAAIRLLRPGMALTLNGIAQGYITDRVADILRARGFKNVLIDMGENYGLGTRGDGTPWRVGIVDPADRARLALTVALADRAVATSGGYGHVFDNGRRHHHLIDPRTGKSARHWASVSVMAPNATLADALSTALSVTTGDEFRAMAGGFPDTEVHAIGTDGRVVQVA